LKYILILFLISFSVITHGKEKAKAKAEKEAVSAIELTETFYMNNRVIKNKEISNYIYKSDNLNKFLYRWCVKKPQSDQQYFEKITAFCELKGGHLLQQKWCLSNLDDSLKFYFEINNPALDTAELNFTGEHCNGKEELFVFLLEYPNPVATNKPRLINCPYKSYPAAADPKKDGGQVAVKIDISSSGIATNTELLQSSGSSVLDGDARRHFSKCEYIPEIKEGVAVAGSVEAKINYTPYKN